MMEWQGETKRLVGLLKQGADCFSCLRLLMWVSFGATFKGALCSFGGRKRPELNCVNKLALKRQHHLFIGGGPSHLLLASNSVLGPLRTAWLINYSDQ